MSVYKAFLNLDHRTDRLNRMNIELARVGVEANRHRGKLPHEFDLNRPELQVMKNRTPGAIGCMYGQMEIMIDAHLVGLHAMVLEDDLVFCSDFKERMDYIANWSLNHEWDVIWLGGTFHVPAFWHRKGGSGMPPNCSAELGKDCETTDDPRMIRTYGAFSTYAYLVNYNSIKKIIDMLNGFMSKTIGIDFSFIALAPQLKTFSFVPGCVKQIDNISDIGTGMTMFSGFSKLNGTEENSRYWWQDKINDFDPSTFNFNA